MKTSSSHTFMTSESISFVIELQTFGVVYSYLPRLIILTCTVIKAALALFVLVSFSGYVC